MAPGHQREAGVGADVFRAGVGCRGIFELSTLRFADIPSTRNCKRRGFGVRLVWSPSTPEPSEMGRSRERLQWTTIGAVPNPHVVSLCTCTPTVPHSGFAVRAFEDSSGNAKDTQGPRLDRSVGRVHVRICVMLPGSGLRLRLLRCRSRSASRGNSSARLLSTFFRQRCPADGRTILQVFLCGGFLHCSREV